MTPINIIDLGIALLDGLLKGFGVKEEYVGIVQSVQAARAQLAKVKDDIITKAELESLRTEKQW